ncbi:hypothetical protein CGMCC3_g8679 [Colletotrichum fructicola]|nr:uncharacterized protein CGMCC3_g8679 [Colletotrichum fructicola]KAE9575382.1 hypothetical protein CGMCC3_g8679 [Colletotrichum fructicola]KAF4428461.1 hypothetical protein CFRS1_v007655 [Colletotrichum fructicola]
MSKISFLSLVVGLRARERHRFQWNQTCNQARLVAHAKQDLGVGDAPQVQHTDDGQKNPRDGDTRRILLRNSTAQNSDLKGAGVVRTQARIFKLVFGQFIAPSQGTLM